MASVYDTPNQDHRAVVSAPATEKTARGPGPLTLMVLMVLLLGPMVLMPKTAYLRAIHGQIHSNQDHQDQESTKIP